MKKKRIGIVLCALAGLLAGWIVGVVWNRRPFTSIAILRVLPPMLPERIVPVSNYDTEQLLPSIVQTMLTRQAMLEYIERYQLYPWERREKTALDMVETLRSAIQIVPAENHTIRISVTYSEPKTAQMVCVNLVSRVMSEQYRARTQNMLLAESFLKDRVEEAGRDWESKLEAVHAAERERRSLDRPKLDAELARQRYIEYQGKLGEAEMMLKVAKSQQGATAEVLEPASMPEDDRLSVPLMAIGGFLIGLIAGLAAFRIFGK